MYKLSALLILVILFNLFTFYKEQHYRQHFKTSKIYDLGHHVFPNLYKHEYIINYIAYLGIIVLIITNNILDFLKLFFIILIIRFLFTQITVLPKMKHCKINHFSPLGYCYDKIFSGHISFIFLCSLFLLETKYISIYTLACINIINSILIISTRAHYTIDVIIAFMVTFFIFQNKKYFLNYL
jgi:hypothetical protein